MLRSSAVSIIQRGLGYRSDLSDDIVSALQEAQRLFELGHSLPDFLKQEDETLIVPSGSADVAFPSGFIKEVDGETFRYTNVVSNKRIVLEKFISLSVLQAALDSDDTTPGAPTAYYVRKSSFVILPERDTTYNLTWSYYKKADILDSDIENAWLANAPEALIGKAGKIVCEDIGLSDSAMKERWSRFDRREKEGWQGAMADTYEKKRMNYSLKMGGRL